jgi:hypothetical protein
MYFGFTLIEYPQFSSINTKLQTKSYLSQVRRASVCGSAAGVALRFRTSRLSICATRFPLADGKPKASKHTEFVIIRQKWRMQLWYYYHNKHALTLI